MVYEGEYSYLKLINQDEAVFVSVQFQDFWMLLEQLDCQPNHISEIDAVGLFQPVLVELVYERIVSPILMRFLAVRFCPPDEIYIYIHIIFGNFPSLLLVFTKQTLGFVVILCCGSDAALSLLPLPHVEGLLDDDFDLLIPANGELPRGEAQVFAVNVEDGEAD